MNDIRLMQCLVHDFETTHDPNGYDVTSLTVTDTAAIGNSLLVDPFKLIVVTGFDSLVDYKHGDILLLLVKTVCDPEKQQMGYEGFVLKRSRLSEPNFSQAEIQGYNEILQGLLYHIATDEPLIPFKDKVRKKWLCLKKKLARRKKESRENKNQQTSKTTQQ